MSLDANLIDLDDKVIYNISGGRHLWWMLPRVRGHRIIVTHDNNESSDLEDEIKFESLNYKKVCCDLLAEELGIDFSIVPKNFYSIRVNLVDLAYGIYFNAQYLNWMPEDLNLEYGIDEESSKYWFKISSITELLNCTNNLFSVSLSDCYPSSYGNDLCDKTFIENLKEFGKFVDNYVN